MPSIQPSQFLITSSDVVLDKRAEGGARLSFLKKGQILDAKVLRVLSDRRALILIKGEVVNARTYLPLREGQALRLKVDRTGSQQVLKFIGEKPAQALDGPLALLNTWGKSGPYRLLPKLMAHLSDFPREDSHPRSNELLSKLGALLSRMALKSGDGGAQFLRSLIQGSGLLWEAKLASALLPEHNLTPSAVKSLIMGDLKALALQALAEQQDADPLTNPLKSFIDGVEKQQLVNQQVFEKFGKYLLPLPVFMSPGFEFGQLLLDLGGRGKEEPKEKELINISFLLSLTRIGDFRADFSIYQQSVTGVFGVADETIHQLVTRWTPMLVDKLTDHGFSVCQISCNVLGPEILSSMTLLDQAVDAEAEGILNLII